jgi:hypothetical protein
VGNATPEGDPTMKSWMYKKTVVIVFLCGLWLIIGILPGSAAQETPSGQIAAVKEVIKEIKVKIDQLEKIVDGMGKATPAEAGKPAVAPSPETTPTAQPRPSTLHENAITWVKCSNWYPYSGMKVAADPTDPYTFVLNGKSEGGFGISSPGGVQPAQGQNVLVIRVVSLGDSKFNCSNRMLKITVGDSGEALPCITGTVSSSDPDFVEGEIGDLLYQIGGMPVSQKLVLAFWQAEVTNLRIKIGVATAQPPQQP